MLKTKSKKQRHFRCTYNKVKTKQSMGGQYEVNEKLKRKSGERFKTYLSLHFGCVCAMQIKTKIKYKRHACVFYSYFKNTVYL